MTRQPDERRDREEGTPIQVGMLLVTVRDFERGPEQAGEDILVVHSTVENPARPLGETGRLPEVELRDEQGRIFEPENLDETWYTPREPNSTADSALRFRVPESSTRLELVIGPGNDGEARVALVRGPR
ncbi:MAG: DUF4352 domain-containing protein [Dehalococcoidia bacterium]|nr:DUF4352 domain-containing protein [Dehalococcoidia bacterium]